MSTYKYSNFYVPHNKIIKPIVQQSAQCQISESSHCNIAKNKIKDVLRKSKDKSKHMLQTALKQSNSNIPLASIDLTKNNKRNASIASLQKCRSELSLQKQVLLKELQSKQQKLQTLKQTFRNIQSTKPKLLLKREDKRENKRNTNFQSFNVGQQNRFTNRQREDFRQSTSSSILALDLGQRTRLFPSNLRQL